MLFSPIVSTERSETASGPVRSVFSSSISSHGCSERINQPFSLAMVEPPPALKEKG